MVAGLDIEWTLTCSYGFRRTDWTRGIDLRIRCASTIGYGLDILRGLAGMGREAALRIFGRNAYRPE